MKEIEILSQIECYLKEEWTILEKKEKDLSPKASQLMKLEEMCKKCTRCELHKYATNLVFSDGSPEAKLVFVGEAPGAEEDAQGKPFVGRAGKLLTATLESMGMPRKDVYICNILKHRPPENRNPLPHEISACTPYLVEQLNIIRPTLIVTLGNFSTKFLLNTEEGISRLRGIEKQSPLGYSVMPTYHPAAVLRNMNLLKDFQKDIEYAVNRVKI